MKDALLIVLCIAVVVLAFFQAINAKRLARIRRRAGRSMHVGPEEHLRLQKQLYDHVAREHCRAMGLQPRLPLEFRSEWGEDALLYDLFRDVPSGVFVEVGALDGHRCSISYVFEAMGWTGLLAEPIPELHALCVKNRPHARVIQAALGPPGSTGTTEFVVPLDPEFQPSAYREHEGMGTEHVRAMKAARAQTRRVTVPMSSADAELARAGFSHVDFAVIDVEGGELELLRGFDLARYRPRVLIIEDNSLGNDVRVVEHMNQAGYETPMWIGANRVFVRRDDDEMIQRCRRATETVYSPFVRVRGHPTEDRRLDRVR